MRKTSISDITSNASNGNQGDRRLSQLRYRKPGGAELSQFDYTYSVLTSSSKPSSTATSLTGSGPSK